MTRRPSTRRVASIALLAALGLLPQMALSGSAAGGAAQPTDPAFAGQPTLLDVDAVAADDVWVVGTTGYRPGSLPSRAIVRHWNGSGWDNPSCPVGSGSNQNSYQAVDATGPDDVWLAGDTFRRGSGVVRPLVAHWDGVSCTRIPIPSPTGGLRVHDVDAFAPDDVVISGGTDVGDNRVRPRLVRHDASGWHPVPAPPSRSGYQTDVYDVSGLSSADMWVSVNDRARTSQVEDPIYHRTAGAWRLVPGPAGNDYVGNFSLAVIDSDDVLAFGTDNAGDGDSALRWTGGPSFDPVPFNDVPYPIWSGMDASDADHAWAVGSYGTDDGRPAVAARWNGVRWIVNSLPLVPGETKGHLNAVSIAPDAVWAVGYYDVGSTGERTSVLRRAGGAWQEMN